MHLVFLLGFGLLIMLQPDGSTVDAKPPGNKGKGGQGNGRWREGLRKSASSVHVRNKNPNADKSINLVEEEIELELAMEGKGPLRKALRNTHITKNKALVGFRQKGQVVQSFVSEDASIMLVAKDGKETDSKEYSTVGIITNDEGLDCIVVNEDSLCESEPGGLDFSNDALPIDLIDTPESLKRESFDEQGEKRKRQSTPTKYYIEICAAADDAFYDLFLDNFNLVSDDARDMTKLFLIALLQEVNSFYSTISSTQMQLEFVMLNVHVCQTANDCQWANLLSNGVVNYRDAKSYLKTDAQRYFSYSSCDIVSGFTGKDLSSSNSGSGVMGVAWLSGACDSGNKININEGFSHLAYVLAHEMGHSLCAPHDPTGCRSPTSVMYNYVGGNDASGSWYAFSSCAVSSFESCVQSSDKSCLTTNSFNEANRTAHICAGFTGNLLDTPEQECQRAWGVNSICPHTVTNICSAEIKCNSSGCDCANGLGCETMQTPDGFLCETGTTKRCYQTQCLDGVATTCSSENTATTPAPTTPAPTTPAPTTPAPTTSAPTTQAPTTPAPTTPAPTTPAPTTPAPTTPAPTTPAPTTPAPTTPAPTTAAPTTTAPACTCSASQSWCWICNWLYGCCNPTS